MTDEQDPRSLSAATLADLIKNTLPEDGVLRTKTERLLDAAARKLLTPEVKTPNVIMRGEIDRLAERVAHLEQWAHEPFDFSDLVRRLERLERVAHEHSETDRGARTGTSALMFDAAGQAALKPAEPVTGSFDLLGSTPYEAVTELIKRDVYRNNVVYCADSRDTYREEEERVNLQFERDIKTAYKVVGHPSSDKAFRLAWERGHSGGLTEVLLEFDTLVELFQPEPNGMPVYATSGVEAIDKERRRQIEVEGFDAKHDRVSSPGEFVAAAVAYARNSQSFWPDSWDLKWFKPGGPGDVVDRRRRLEKAGALIAAAIDRLDRN